MASDDMNLKVVINADTSAMDSALSSLAQQLNKVGNSSATESINKLENATKNASKSAEKATESHRGLAEGLEDLNQHTRTVAMGFSALGLEGEAAAVKVEALAGVLGSIEKVSPILLAIGVSLAALSFGFVKLKEAVSDFAAEQSKLVSITSLIKNQGGAWRENSDRVQEYATKLALAGSFAKGDILTGMQSMLAAGLSTNDMLHSQSAALNLAAATGISVAEAERQLADAYNGRMRGLTQLGLISREEMKHGIAYEEVLKRIAARMGGDASAAMDTFAGKMQNLKNISEEQSAEIGESLNPVLEKLGTMMINAEKSLQTLVDGFKKWAEANKTDLINGLTALGEILSQVASVAIPLLFHGIEDTLLVFAKFSEWFAANEKIIGEFFETVIGVTAVKALITLATTITSETIPALLAWASTLIGTALSSLRVFITAVSVDAVAAFVELGIAMAVSTCGITLLIGSLVASGIYLANNWSSVVSEVETLWDRLAGNIEIGVVRMERAISSLMRSAGAMMASAPMGSGAHDIGTALISGSNSLIKDAHNRNNDAYRLEHTRHNNGVGWKHTAASPSVHLAGENILDKPEGNASSHEIPSMSGGKKKGTGKSASDFTLPKLAINAAEYDAIQLAQQKLQENLVKITESEQKYKDTVAEATSIQQQDISSKALLSKELMDAADKHKILNTAIYNDTSEQEKLDAQINKNVASQNKYRSEMAALITAIKKKGEASKADEAAMKALKREHDAAGSSTEELKKKYSELTSNIKANTAASLSNSKAVHDIIEAQKTALDALILSQNKYNEAKAREINDDKNTDSKNPYEQAQYYQAQYLAFQEKFNADISAKNEKAAQDDLSVKNSYEDKMLSSEKSYNAKVSEDNKKALEERKTALAGFFGDLQDKTKGFGEIWKDLWKKVMSDALKSLSDGLASNGQMSKILGIFGIGNIQNTSGGDGKSLNVGGILSGTTSSSKPDGSENSPIFVTIKGLGSTIIPGGGALPVTSLADGTIPVSSDTIGSNTSSDSSLLEKSLSKVFGAENTPNKFGDTVSSYLKTSNSNAANFDGGNSNAADMNNSSFGDWGNSNSTSNSKLGFGNKSMAGALQGIAMGQMAAGLLGENSGNAQIGGGIGSAIGSIIPGIGTLIGGLAGSLLGGLFGPHETIADQPDLHDGAYAQNFENLNGGLNPDGKGNLGFAGFPGLAPDAKYSVYAGQKNESEQIHDYLQNVNRGSLNTQQLSLIDKFNQLSGGQADGLELVSERQGTATLKSGASVSVSDFDTYMNNLHIMESSTSSTAPAFSLSHLNGGRTSNLAQMSASNALTQVQFQNGQAPNAVNININGNTFAGAGGIQDLANLLSQAMNKNVTNGNFGNAANALRHLQ